MDPMRGWVDSFPEMLEEAWGAPVPDRFAVPTSRVTLLAGMGGSGMAGALAATRLARLGRLAVPWRDPGLPDWVEERDSIILVSYSGETWETLALFDAAVERGIPIRTIASGGGLADRSSALGVPCFRVPPGMAPRASLPWLLAAVFRATGGIDDGAIGAATAALRSDRHTPEPGRDPNRIAEAIGRRIAVILPAGDGMETVAIRWRNQILENAKQAAFVSPLPEMAHNEIMGWGHLRDAIAPIVFVALTSADLPRRVAGLLGALEEEARSERHPFVAVPACGADGFAGLLAQTQLGDRVSVAMADRLGLAATPVDAIRRLRDRMGKERI
jgi:glucose/mannose-6-phosphate isomerase